MTRTKRNGDYRERKNGRTVHTKPNSGAFRSTVTEYEVTEL